MKKGSFSTIILILILVAGLSLLLYPSFSNYWNDLHQTKAIADYNSVVADMSEEDCTYLFEDAAEYNEALRSIRFPFTQVLMLKQKPLMIKSYHWIRRLIFLFV